jgi:MYXO-CTERM domain-containing protein
MNARRALALSVAVALGVLTFSPDADACGGPLGYVCRGTTVVAVPTNPPTIELRAAASNVEATGLVSLVHSTTPPTVSVTDKDGANVDVTVTAHPSGGGRWILTPTAPLVTGAQYKVKWETECDPASGAIQPQTTGEAEITAPAPASPPTALGTIAVKGPLKRPMAANSCDGVNYTGDEVVAEVTLTPDATFAPWKESVGWTMLFDGKPPPPNPSWEQTWSDSNGWLRASCASPDVTGITPAVHEISFTATVPGSATPLTAKTTVDFSCATAPTTLQPSTGATGGGPVPENNDTGCAVATSSTSSTSSLTTPALLLLSVVLAATSRSSRRRRRS